MFKMKIDLDDKEFKQYLVTELDNLTDKSKADKAIHQSIQNWIDAKPFPYMKNIEYLTEIFSKKLSISKDELKQYFLVAKLINNSELSKEIIFDKNTNFVSTGQFEELVEEYCEPQYSDISRLAFKLFKLSDIETEKTEESEKEFNVIFKKINEQGYSVENMPYIAWSKARYHAQKKEFKEATDYYVLALENGKNSMGKHYIDIAKEGLIVSAHTTRKDKLDLKNAKSPFVKFHKEAYFLKLIDSLPDEINQYFLNDMKKKFSTYFTKLYPDIKTTKGEFNAHEHSIIYIPDIESIKLDLKKPDKWIKHKYPNPMTQLMHAAYWVRYGDVKQLIDGGANANEMRFNDNATALTMVLSNEFTGEKRDDAIKIAKLLISKMSEEALCAKLPKKKMTALGLAIDSGYVEIAKQLIEKGADINQTITPVNMSPLYYTVNKIGESKMDSSTFVNKMQFTNDSEILKIVNSMPSTVPFLNNAITDQEKIEAFKKLQRHVDSTPRNREMGDEASHFIMEEIRRHIKEYNQIFELLLNAHPNLELRFKGNLNTVLMLATELNEVELVKKLLDAGADKNATTINNDNIQGLSLTAKSFAIENKNKELMSLL